jgi:membrane-associated protease RseP (regulator of RpoE activity)
LSWDGDGGLPDPVVRLYRGDTLVWESEAVEDTLRPRFAVTLPRNVWVPEDRELRLELWDQDAVGSDPIGVWRGKGLPDNALPDAEARLLLEGRATLVIRISDPVAHRGTGLARYELRGDRVKVLKVTERSPAARAGIEPGDRITAVDGVSVEAMGPSETASSLSMAGSARGTTLTVQKPDGSRHQVPLDGNYVWLTM